MNVFQTAHTDGTGGTVNNTVGGTEYAIANVFGGGNQADFRVTDKTASVNIYTCYNTVRRVFGGGNAAATNSVATLIQGGRFHQVFGGGNGERGAAYAANVYGDVDLVLHGGYVDEFYGGSNQHGAISEGINVAVDNNGPCEGNLLVDEFFCGGNFVDITGDLVTTIGCSQGININNFYGGCNQANVKGNVILNLYGGNYTNVFGGSKGVVGGIAANIEDNPNTPNVTEGNVTLNLFGGTIENVYGGSNYNGNITGRVIVNVLDVEDPICPLIITNIYGGSNETNYQPTDPTLISPVVNVMHAKYNISGNVYGGSRGVVGTEVTVKANPLLNIGYVNSMSTYVSDILSHLPVGAVIPAVPVDPQVVISGSVFGGGDMAKVEGNTEIRLQNRSKVYGNVYGGGNMGEVIDNTATTTVVEGNTKVIVNGKVVE